MILPGDIFPKKEDLTWKKLKSFFERPALVLVFLNIFIHIFIYTFQPSAESLESDIQWIKKSSNLKAMKQMHIQAQDPILKEEMKLKSEVDPYLFIKDIGFWKKAQNMDFVGDQVQIEKNKIVLQHLRSAFENSTQETYGLSANTSSALNWVTYQFTHASVFHLISNVVFLFLIVSLLQQSVSFYWIGSVYLLSGLAAGAAYLMFCDELSLPLLGASGAVSGLMAFLCVIKAQQNIKWSYFISPFKGGFGTLFLPAYLLFPIYLLTDFTNTLVDVHGVTNSVAHSAHIGGVLCGFILGLTYRSVQIILFPFQEQIHDESYFP